MKIVTVKGVSIGEGRPKIIVPLIEKTENELIAEAHKLSFIACDLVEWRIDFFEESTDFTQVAAIAKRIRTILNHKPLLATFRTEQEGGERPFSEKQYFDLYHTLVESGVVDLIDIELFMDEKKVATIIKAAQQKDIKVVMCNHDFRGTPSKDELISRLCQMQEKQADICKIAVMPNSSEDVLTLLEATNEMKMTYADRPIITMSMGPLGMISRISGELFGSAATFGADKKTSAPGQIPVEKLHDWLLFLASETEN